MTIFKSDFKINDLKSANAKYEFLMAKRQKHDSFFSFQDGREPRGDIFEILYLFVYFFQSKSPKRD
jgi:hypothetical protein